MTRAFADVVLGLEVPVLARVVTREDVRAYAEAGGDLNPLHLDDAAARAAGLPGIIAHGMFTMGHMAACVVTWCGGPEAITRLVAQFRSPVFLGETIVAGGRVASLDPRSRTVGLDTWVTVQREGTTEHAVRKGQVVVQLG